VSHGNGTTWETTTPSPAACRRSGWRSRSPNPCCWSALENHAFIERLKSLGVSLALDDFGTGYSSLGSLTAFPFNKIKIDKSFIADLTRNYKSTAIVCAIVTLAGGLDMSVTVEGVETREQFERLKSLGVNVAQGYLMGRPVPIDELERQPQVYRPRQEAA
jgi:EAL domain-containing protein (putative c-di-GMP-specific phosphodiesterase class I)